MTAGLVGGTQDFPLTLTHVLGRARTVHGRAEVVTQRDAEGTRTRATMAAVGARADRLAAALRGLGVEPGDRVGSFAWNTQEHLEAYYAVPCSGAVLHTLNPRLSPEQIAFTINHAGDRVLLVDPALVGEMERVLPLLDSVERFVVIGDGDPGELPDPLRYEELLAAEDDGFDWPELDERAGAALCYTSGTTGDPKGVLYSHRALCLHTLVMAGHDAYRISERDRVLAVVPMFHAMGWNLGYLAGAVGADLVMPGRFVQSPHLARLIGEERITATCGVPTIWMDLLREEGADLSSLELAICGGTQVPPELMREYERRHDVKVVQGWGMTETLPGAALAHDPPGAGEEERWRRREHAGRLTPFYEARIVADDGSPAPNDGVTTGEVELRGPTVIGSYFENPGASAAAMHDGWLRTGDVGTLDGDGWLRITDRAKDVIKSGGEWISSVDIESALMAHPAVAEAAVIALPDERWSERPLACVVAPGEGVEPEELREFIAPRVAKWWLPDEFAFLDEIPKTSVGKFDKKVLRQMLAADQLGERRRVGAGSAR
ncbi:MAG TPA: long-chain fatty acid--CoA ligase [Solirubrobacterales bacterium]|nr:long-chain fatty acid--CoA ligase [Solirubrobacterales bacterium]